MKPLRTLRLPVNSRVTPDIVIHPAEMIMHLHYALNILCSDDGGLARLLVSDTPLSGRYRRER